MNTEKILTKESKEKFFGKHSIIKDPILKKEIDYGYGWRTSEILGKRCVSHSGRIYGFSSEFLRFIDDNLSVLVLSNIATTPTTQLALNLAKKIIDKK